MKSYEILDAIGGIDTKYIENAARKKKHAPLWPKIISAAACLCLLVGAAIYFKPDMQTPPVVDNVIDIPNDTSKNIPDGTRGDTPVLPSSNQSDEPVVTGDVLSIFENSPVGINDTFMQTISALAVQAGWNEVNYTLYDEYSFTLHGQNNESINNMSQDEILKNTQEFLHDSGIENLLSIAGIAYELEVDSDDTIPLSFCYLLCEGERTGAYIRFVFEGSKVLGECQAFIYASECIENLEKLSFEEALNQAFYTENNEFIPVNVADYAISNERIVYVNGLPYYSFVGHGINSRSRIDGYALAVNIEASSIRDKLMEKQLNFNFE